MPTSTGVPDWYQPLAGQTECRPCPAGSYAHFPGSTVCVACYFGKAVVMADGNGVYTGVTAEQPSHGGYRHFMRHGPGAVATR